MIMKNYIKRHIESGEYEASSAKNGAYSYFNKKGWTDRIIHDDLIFSHRTNEYTQESFDEGFHSHEYYEVILYASGNVEYVCENDVYKPLPGMVVACSPDIMHTARLVDDSVYDRYVFYFNRSYFTYCGEEIALPAFFTDKKTHGALQPDDAQFSRLQRLAKSIEESASLDTPVGRFLAHSFVIQLFALLDGNDELGYGKNDKLPENVARIKKYIDTYYNSIEGVSEIASYFFYSREHASRLFRQYFNITLSEYLMQRRVAESTKLLLEGESVASACYTVGFRSVSSYINAFRRITGCLPSEYKKRR